MRRQKANPKCRGGSKNFQEINMDRKQKKTYETGKNKKDSLTGIAPVGTPSPENDFFSFCFLTRLKS